jgi:hypothetical protein
MHTTRSKCDSPNETKIKEKQNKTIPELNSNLAKSMTHHNQTKELTTWFLSVHADSPITECMMDLEWPQDARNCGECWSAYPVP